MMRLAHTDANKGEPYMAESTHWMLEIDEHIASLTRKIAMSSV